MIMTTEWNATECCASSGLLEAGIRRRGTSRQTKDGTHRAKDSIHLKLMTIIDIRG